MKWHIILMVLLVIPFAAAEGHMKLLAVKEMPNGFEGSIADLYLDIKPGSGRVFLDTFPLTKLDTQMSTRFAKSIACDYLDIDCDNYDFFYTITAQSSIIGGPSAGASITLMTILMLEHKPIDENIALTGTINSGGLIGPVGGVKEKIEAAAKAGIKKVLIPKGERYVKETDENINNTFINNIIGIYNITNSTEKEIDMVAFGKEKGVEVIEASNIEEGIYQLTGESPKKNYPNLTTNEQYQDTMRGLSIDLCNRSTSLSYNTISINNNTKQLLEEAKNLSEKGRKAFENKRYYPSASYCFGANVKYAKSILISTNLTKEEALIKTSTEKQRLKSFERKLGQREVKTITDLEAKMVVKERIIEAEHYFNLSFSSNNTDEIISNLAYGIERAYSAHSWYTFFDNRGKKFDMNIDTMKKSCQDKVSEAEERYQYVNLYMPSKLESTRREIDDAYADLATGEYAMCLFKASKAKAEVDVILSLMGVEEKHADDAISQKLKAVEKVIAKEIENDIFPVLGYSYYEYANDLRETDKYSAMLYSEYALELSNLDMYFKEKKTIKLEDSGKKPIYIFLGGAASGFIAALILFIVIKTRAEHPKQRTKRRP